MRFGVFLLPAQFPGQDAGDVLRRAVAVAAAAERSGFDDVWIAEHHFMSYGVCPSAATLAGYLLGNTSTIVVGTAVSVLSTQHPVALAEQAAVLHQVSGGRFRLGIGRGSPLVDLNVFGTGIARYERGFAESLDLLLDALRYGRAAASGDFFDFEEVSLVPQAASLPSPALAAISEASISLAARRGLPLLLGMHEDDAAKSARLAHYLRAGGEQDSEHIAVSVAQVGDTTGGAQHLVRDSLPRWLAPGLAGYRRADGRPHGGRDPVEYTAQLCAIHPIGSPQYCVDRLAETVTGTGVRRHLLMVEAAGEQDEILWNVTRLGEKVLPVLREQLDVSSRHSGFAMVRETGERAR